MREKLESLLQLQSGMWDIYSTTAQWRTLRNLQRAILAMYGPWRAGPAPRLDER